MESGDSSAFAAVSLGIDVVNLDVARRSVGRWLVLDTEACKRSSSFAVSRASYYCTVSIYVMFSSCECERFVASHHTLCLVDIP